MIQFVATRLSKSVCERCHEQEFTERCPERCQIRGINTLYTILALILGTVNFANASTSHSGFINSDEIWTLAGSPHIIQSLTVVQNNATLTIEPGVEVRFNNDATNPSLIIGEGGIDGKSGRLIAQGAATNKIIFTSNAASPQPGDWSHIYFNNTAADDSIIENAVIEYAKDSIYLTSANPAIRNCIIRKNSNAGIYMMGTSSPEVSFCDITENIYGIYSAISSGTPKFIHNNISGNSSYGIYNPSSSIILNAVNNWWGDPSGPYDPSDDTASGGWYNPGGLGDKVSNHVKYTPWQNGIISINGDVNGDSIVDLTDGIAVLQILSGIQSQIQINPGADVDNDGKITMAEELYILQKIAGLR